MTATDEFKDLQRAEQAHADCARELRGIDIRSENFAQAKFREESKHEQLLRARYEYRRAAHLPVPSRRSNG